MRMPTSKQRPRKATVDSFPSPTGGLVSNRNLALSRGENEAPAAAVMNNCFPTATSVITRRGSRKWATLGDGTKPVRSMFTYISGAADEMFAATDSTIYNVSSVPFPDNGIITDELGNPITDELGNILGWNSTIGLEELTGKTGGDWNVVQFATAGGSFLVGVNGMDAAFLYNGTTFTATTITFPVGAGLTTANLSYVWIYKQRIWFIEKDSLNAWYLPVDQVGGELVKWPMGGIFVLGGTLQWGQAWSLDSGSAGGLSEQCVFCTTEGEIAAFQGLSPDVDQGWSKAGLYRIGKPLGAKSFTRAGGDLLISTSVGLISLASASRMDYAALGQSAVSHPIEDDWAQAVGELGVKDWRVKIWADGQMAIIAPPQLEGRNPEVLVSNVNTGKWCKFNGWDVAAMTVFDGKLFFGSNDGCVRQGWVGGSDDGNPFVWQVLPLFSDLGDSGAQKTLKTARAVTRSPNASRVQVSGHVNFLALFPAAPPAAPQVVSNLWDVGIWDQATWGGRSDPVTIGEWVSVGGAGHDISVGVQGTSGSPAAVDIELIRIDVTYQGGEIGS